MKSKEPTESKESKQRKESKESKEPKEHKETFVSSTFKHCKKFSSFKNEPKGDNIYDTSRVYLRTECENSESFVTIHP
jgi:hypothetical protein